MSKCKIIVIEGTDGSGKATQTKLLKERLEKEGYSVFSTSFPNYESQSSALVKMYLSGDISKDANDVLPKAASIFYAADRYITYKKEIEEIYNAGDRIILLDRYVSSNIIHQGAKIVSNTENDDELKQFISWLDNFEHGDLEIPRADKTIFLHVPAEYTIKLREGRSNKFTGGEVQDIHESNIEHLKSASKSGMMAAKILNWDIIDCLENDSMRTIEDIGEEIFKVVKQII